VQAVIAQVVGSEPVRPTAIFVQVGAFSQYDNASRLRAKAAAAMGATKISEANVAGQAFYRVRIGPAASVDDADKLLDLAVRAGYHDARIVVE
ncbi:MAG: SPOR domain-containing protein, partial [Alphaproteobacteria bacterium]